MAYQLKLGREPLRKGIRRIISREFDRMVDTLDDRELTPARQVHEVRKSIKRLRSLLRLIAPVTKGAGDENARLRDAARRLSGSRDAGAVLDLLERLDLPPATCLAVKAALHDTMDAHALKADGTAQLLERFRDEIRVAAKHADALDIRDDGFDTVEGGLRANYRKLRTRFAEADQTREEIAIHDWRKSAKLHWHHTRLLMRLCPDLLEAHARIAGRLSDNLGEWRDSGLLLAALPTGALAGEALETVQQALFERQKSLLRQAISDSRILTAETPANLSGRWRAYWNVQSS